MYYVIYDNPMQALTCRYAVLSGGTVVHRASSRKAAWNWVKRQIKAALAVWDKEANKGKYPDVSARMELMRQQLNDLEGRG